MHRTFFKKLVISLVIFRALILATCAFLPLSLPGIWRQTDTLGVALRYWIRWSVEYPAKLFLLPAVLNSGDSSGIMPMEFPILNLFFAPVFIFGPYWGRVLAVLGIVILVHGLIYLNYRIWKPHHKTLGVDSFAFFLIAIATFSSGWTGKFMPDVISVLLVLLAVGISWSKNRPLLSCFICTIGILMKPTSVVVMILYLAHPQFIQKIRSYLLWSVCSVMIAVIYYTIGLQWITQYQDRPGLFAIEFRPFFQSLVIFFSDVADWGNMWLYRTFFSLGAILIVPLSIFVVIKKKLNYKQFSKIWLVLLTQYVIIAGLSGVHGFVHDYYFMGLAPTAALILWWLISNQWPKWIPITIFVGMLIPTIELSLMDLRPVYKKTFQDQLKLPGICESIKLHHPEVQWNSGKVFRSSDEAFPALGLCFGERQGSHTAPYGFFWNGELPTKCQPIEVTKLITFAKCE